MKCPSCGYFNLPGLLQCSSCGLSFQSATDGPQQPAQWSEVLPPRAKNRSTAQKVGQRLGRPYRLGRSAVSGVQQAVTQTHQSYQNHIFSLQLSLRDWLMILMALIPGLPQLIRKRWPVAAGLIAAFVLSLGSLRLSFYNAFFDLAVLLFLALLAFSVWDTANDIQPPLNSNKKNLREIRLAFLSVSVVASVCSLALFLFSFRYNSAYIFNDIGAPFFKTGDYLLIENLPSHKALRRGDLIVAGNQVDRVIGFGGDQIEARGGNLYVNQKLVVAANLPLQFRNNPVPDFSDIVPHDSVALWMPMRGAIPNEGFVRLPLNYQEFDNVAGRVVAIHAPARRRQWVK